MRFGLRRGALIAFAVVAVASGRSATASDHINDLFRHFHTIPRETLAKDYRTGGIYYAPPIPYGTYTKDYVGGIHAALGAPYGLLCKVCGLCKGAGCGACGMHGCQHGNACGDCGGKGCGHCGGDGLLAGLCRGCKGNGCGFCGNSGHFGHGACGDGSCIPAGGHGLLGHKGGHGHHGVLPSAQGAPVLPSAQGAACGLCGGLGKLRGGARCGGCGGLGKLGGLCGGCGGHGLINGKPCGACGGKGCGVLAGHGNLGDPCDACGGHGHRNGMPCGKCGGSGLCGHLGALGGAVHHVAGTASGAVHSALYRTGLAHDRVDYFVGPGGPVPLTPGYVPYVVPVRSPRDFFAFPPFVDRATGVAP
jgi:hypothetical protein